MAACVIRLPFRQEQGAQFATVSPVQFTFRGNCTGHNSPTVHLCSRQPYAKNVAGTNKEPTVTATVLSILNLLRRTPDKPAVSRTTTPAEPRPWQPPALSVAHRLINRRRSAIRARTTQDTSPGT
jgi:hypothetical protein